MTEEQEALIHLRTLIKAASASDDIDLIYKLLREMRQIVNKTLPVRRKPKLKVVKK